MNRKSIAEATIPEVLFPFNTVPAWFISLISDMRPHAHVVEDEEEENVGRIIRRFSD